MKQPLFFPEVAVTHVDAERINSILGRAYLVPHRTLFIQTGFSSIAARPPVDD